MELSIVIPAWNESSKIEKDILTLDSYFTESGLSGEIIIVDDGSDDHTAEKANSVNVSKSATLNVIKHDKHRGKGFAVRAGILAAGAEWILFMDSGNNVPVSFITLGFNLVKNENADIAIGSRHLTQSKILKSMIWYRKLISYLFRKYIAFTFKSLAQFSDTQCGFKIFKRNIAWELFSNCHSDGFLFDIEVLLVAVRKKYKIVEFPLEWRCDRDSRLTMLPTFISVFRELRRLKSIT